MKKYIFFFLFSFNSLFAIEVTCKFEEVYKNGEVQQGALMIKDNMLRYQYFNKDLYTIISRANKFFLLRNDTKIVQKLDEKTGILKNIVNLVSDFPDINDTYKYDEVLIKVEKGSNSFIKRLSIQSNDVNMSINFFSCSFDRIKRKYFLLFNFVEYSQ